jgi:anti-sigma B factor antagonist
VTYLTVERTADRTLVVSGELDMASEAELRRALEDLIGTDGPVEVNLAAVTFIDSSGTRAIIDAAIALRDRGGLTVSDPSATVVRVFELFGLMPAQPAIPLDVRWDGGVSRSGPGAVHRLDALINRAVEAQTHARMLSRVAGELIAANRERRLAAPPASADAP